MTRQSHIADLLAKASKSLRAAEILLKEDLPDFAASRVYYSMFYAVEALLLTKGLSFSKHAGVVSAFGKEFVKTGEFHPELHRQLRDAFRWRQAGDYSATPVVTKKVAHRLIAQASEFIQAIEKYLKQQGQMGGKST
ncbi:MAG: HEPN domain-containing protein [Planctomycetota bacterium]